MNSPSILFSIAIDSLLIRLRHANRVNEDDALQRFNRDLVKNTPLILHGFGVETQLVSQSLYNQYFNVKEIEIELRFSLGSELKLKPLSDGFRVILTIDEYRPLYLVWNAALLFFSWVSTRGKIGC